MFIPKNRAIIIILSSDGDKCANRNKCLSYPRDSVLLEGVIHKKYN